MSDTNAPEKDDGSRRAHSTNPSIPSPSLQAPPERPWLSRARYFLREDELESLTLPGSEGTSAQNTICFSRAFLSKFLGGSQQPAYANIKFDHHHVYHLAAYYVGKPEWNPQFPKGSGVHGALLVVGTSFQMPPVPWPTPKGVNPGDHREKFKPVNCFAKRSSAEYQYIGRYVFHPEFRKLTKEEVERHIPKAACDLWTKGIDTSKWGTKLKSKLVAMNADVTNGDAKHGTTEGKKAEELFDLPDDDPRKLCFYWEYMEYIGYDRALYNALCSKGEEIGWTTRDITTSQALTNSEGVKGEPAINMEQFDTDQSAAPMLSDEDSDRLEEESKIMIGPEDLKQMMTKESPPSKNARV